MPLANESDDGIVFFADSVRIIIRLLCMARSRMSDCGAHGSLNGDDAETDDDSRSARPRRRRRLCVSLKSSI
jgi:hypothetical protein